jgi:hypothetical protein
MRFFSVTDYLRQASCIKDKATSQAGQPTISQALFLSVSAICKQFEFQMRTFL